MSVPMTLSDLERREAIGQILQAGILNVRLTLNDRIRQDNVGRGVFTGGQPHPPQGDAL